VNILFSIFTLGEEAVGPKGLNNREREDCMQKIVLSIIGVFFASGLLFGAEAMKPIRTEKAREGVTRKIYSEEPSDIPGYTVVIRDVIQAPGAKSEKVTEMKMPMFCTMIQGELTDDLTGKKRVKGESWTCKIGDKTQSRNTGKVDAIMREHVLMPTKEKMKQ